MCQVLDPDWDRHSLVEFNQGDNRNSLVNEVFLIDPDPKVYIET